MHKYSGLLSRFFSMHTYLLFFGGDVHVGKQKKSRARKLHPFLFPFPPFLCSPLPFQFLWWRNIESFFFLLISRCIIAPKKYNNTFPVYFYGISFLRAISSISFVVTTRPFSFLIRTDHTRIRGIEEDTSIYRRRKITIKRHEHVRSQGEKNEMKLPL